LNTEEVSSLADGNKPTGESNGAETDRSGVSYRQLFESTLHKRSREERIALAKECSGPMLCAFCFDPDPGVILNGVLANQHTGLEHARLLAANHRSTQGLQGLAARTQLLADAQVQRHLLRNVQSGEPLLRRVLSNKPLQLLFQTLMGRELSESARRIATQVFKKRFQTANPDEKIGVIFTSEGRCLRFLIGVPLDGRSATTICKRSAFSTMLVQSLVRWPTTPPQVLRHLAKQGVVRQNAGLKRSIMQHPNCPNELKRGGI
jgi:hypothetical protein